MLVLAYFFKNNKLQNIQEIIKMFAYKGNRNYNESKISLRI